MRKLPSELDVEILKAVLAESDFSFGGQTSLPETRLDIDSVLPTLQGWVLPKSCSKW